MHRIIVLLCFFFFVRTCTSKTKEHVMLHQRTPDKTVSDEETTDIKNDDSLLVNDQMLEVEADDYVPEKPIKHGKLLSQKKAEVRDKAEDPARNEHVMLHQRTHDKTMSDEKTTDMKNDEVEADDYNAEDPARNASTPSPTSPAINVSCGQNEMAISIPKDLLPGIDVEHLRLSDLSCQATEDRTRFFLRTDLTSCRTKIRHTSRFVTYSNKVEEVPVGPNQTITRVREVEIPFTCFYSNTGVVSAIGIKVESKKIFISKNGNGQFVLEMKIFRNSRFRNEFRKGEFPVVVSLRQILFVKVLVSSDDTRLSILAEKCFATPDADPSAPGLKYTFIDNGCSVDQDDTLRFIPTNDTRTTKFSLEAFSFVGDNPFVYMHCKVRICNASDPNSRCAQGCIRSRRRRALTEVSPSKDDVAYLAQGPFMREDEKEREADETKKDVRDEDTGGDYSEATHSTLVAALAVMAVACVLVVSYAAVNKRKQKSVLQYQLLTASSED
ncbi:ZP domain-containing protein-like isoform X2 [Acropora palmata]|uniref:ZP domain-containing protein-like isoform X2 n=1 Tax=Acropora palmata TaxID=6131 RepID=UPI003DA03EB7